MSDFHPYILLIDDDPDDLDMLSRSLKSLDLHVKTFLSSDSAISYLNLNKGNLRQPSLIILDYNMPKINGHEALVLIKRQEHNRRIPVVMYSTCISPSFRKIAMELGAVACFTKPVSLNELDKQVRFFKNLAFSRGRQDAEIESAAAV